MPGRRDGIRNPDEGTRRRRAGGAGERLLRQTQAWRKRQPYKERASPTKSRCYPDAGVIEQGSTLRPQAGSASVGHGSIAWSFVTVLRISSITSAGVFMASITWTRSEP
jgi:hypothetical protein